MEYTRPRTAPRTVQAAGTLVMPKEVEKTGDWELIEALEKDLADETLRVPEYRPDLPRPDDDGPRQNVLPPIVTTPRRINSNPSYHEVTGNFDPAAFVWADHAYANWAAPAKN